MGITVLYVRISSLDGKTDRQRVNEKVFNQMYGQIPSSLLKKLVCFHTSYHLNQFGLFP